MRQGRLVAVMTVSAMLCTGCTGRAEEPPEPAGPSVFDLGGGARLVVPKGALPEGASVVSEPLGGELPVIPGLVSVGAVEVEASQQPVAPVLVEVPVPRAAFADLPIEGDRAVLVMHQHADDDWEPLTGRLDRNRAVVQVETDKLSTFDVRLPSVTGLRDQAFSILNGFFGSVDFRPAAPKCQGEKAAREAGYSVTSTEFPVLQWCLGLDSSGKPELKVVASRRYALVANLSQNLKVVQSTGGELPVALTQAFNQAIAGDRLVTLSPGGTTVFDLNVTEGQQARLTAEFDGLAQSLVSLQVAATILAEMAAKMPFSKSTAKSTAEALQAVDAAKCVPALINLGSDVTDSGRVGAMASACLNPQTMFAGLSQVVMRVLIEVVAVLGGVVAYMWTSASGLVDELRGESTYTITVSKRRQPQPADLGKFIGEWYVHGAQMTISRGGTGTISSYPPCGPSLEQSCHDLTKFRYTPTANGQELMATVTEVQFLSEQGVDLAMMGEYYTAYEVGDAFSLRQAAPHLLITTNQGGGPEGNPYWCQDGVSADDAYNCGA